MDFHDVNEFWFQEAGPKRWFDKDPAFDRLIEHVDGPPLEDRLREQIRPRPSTG